MNGGRALLLPDGTATISTHIGAPWGKLNKAGAATATTHSPWEERAGATSGFYRVTAIHTTARGRVNGVR